MNRDIKKGIELRRSYYAIMNESTLANHEIEELIKFAAKHSPSAFNSQSSRIVLLLGEEHLQLWQLVKKTLQKIVSKESFPATEKRLNSFAEGYGTILFFEDYDTVEGMQKQFPLYEDSFPLWSMQSSGIQQYIVWTLIENAGMGASLQHYNPLIDEEVKKVWNLPSNWKLMSQMPFGKIAAEPNEKTYLPIEERVLVFK